MAGPEVSGLARPRLETGFIVSRAIEFVNSGAGVEHRAGRGVEANTRCDQWRISLVCLPALLELKRSIRT